jgi:hypothetical protein
MRDPLLRGGGPGGTRRFPRFLSSLRATPTAPLEERRNPRKKWARSDRLWRSRRKAAMERSKELAAGDL